MFRILVITLDYKARTRDVYRAYNWHITKGITWHITEHIAGHITEHITGHIKCIIWDKTRISIYLTCLLTVFSSPTRFHNPDDSVANSTTLRSGFRQDHHLLLVILLMIVVIEMVIQCNSGQTIILPGLEDINHHKHLSKYANF